MANWADLFRFLSPNSIINCLKLFTILTSYFATPLIMSQFFLKKILDITTFSCYILLTYKMSDWFFKKD